MRRRSFLGFLLSTTSALAGGVSVPGVPRPIGDPSSAVRYPQSGGTAPPSPPASSVAPVASGTATVGSTLACTQGTWTNSPTGYAYQWLRNGVNIPGATSSTYLTVAADGGTSVGCTVTASNAGGSASQASNTLAIAPAPSAPVNTVAPVVSGTATVGSTLACTQGTWTNSPTSYAYQWQRGGTNISGATSSTYVTVSADGGTPVGCLVTATNASGSGLQASNTLAIAAGGHSAQALAYLARTVGGNEGGNGANIATLIDGLVADGVWAKLDCLYVLAQQNQTDALLNLIGATFNLTNVSANTFTAYVGYSNFSNTGGNLGTAFNPSTATPNFTQNSASFGLWVYSGGPDFDPQMGDAAGLNTMYIDYAGIGFIARVNNNSIGGNSPPADTGLFSGDRTSSTNVVPYWNGTAQTAQSGASSVPNTVFSIGGVPSFPGTHNTISEAHIGASLGGAGQLAFYNRLRTYMTAIGVP